MIRRKRFVGTCQLHVYYNFLLISIILNDNLIWHKYLNKFFLKKQITFFFPSFNIYRGGKASMVAPLRPVLFKSFHKWGGAGQFKCSGSKFKSFIGGITGWAGINSKNHFYSKLKPARICFSLNKL
jgi:hypothetical protein